MITLEKKTGFDPSQTVECLAQYFMSKKMPLRMDLISADLTATQ